MFPIYDKAEFDAILATDTADGVWTSTTLDLHFKQGSTAALAPPASTAGVHLTFAALVPGTNTVKTIWSKSS